MNEVILMAWFAETDAAYKHWIPKGVQQTPWADCDWQNLDSTYNSWARLTLLNVFYCFPLSRPETFNTQKPHTSMLILH